MKLIKAYIVVLFSTLALQAFGAETIIINDPRGGQTVCIVQGSYVTCY